jgi:hypothetical protein
MSLCVCASAFGHVCARIHICSVMCSVLSGPRLCADLFGAVCVRVAIFRSCSVTGTCVPHVFDRVSMGSFNCVHVYTSVRSCVCLSVQVVSVPCVRPCVWPCAHNSVSRTGAHVPSCGHVSACLFGRVGRPCSVMRVAVCTSVRQRVRLSMSVGSVPLCSSVPVFRSVRSCVRLVFGCECPCQFVRSCECARVLGHVCDRVFGPVCACVSVCPCVCKRVSVWSCACPCVYPCVRLCVSVSTQIV